MKTTQLFRKRNRVLALLNVTMMLILLGVIFRENFTEDVGGFRETFTVQALSVGIIFREN